MALQNMDEPHIFKASFVTLPFAVVYLDKVVLAGTLLP
jgi:hypothetical protein